MHPCRNPSLLVLHYCSESLLVLTFVREGGVAHLAPETHVEVEAVIGPTCKSEGDTQCKGKGEGDSEKTGPGGEDEVWFLKHRRGVKG